MHLALDSRLKLALIIMIAMSQLFEPVYAKRKLCGSELSDALDMICVNGFRRLRMQRDLLQIDIESSHILRAIQQRSDDEVVRPRRNIVHKCCKEGCHIEDIKEYCEEEYN